MRALMGFRAPVVAALLCASCHQPEAPPSQSPVSVELGSHRVRFVVPQGWRHADHGIQQIFEREIARISLSDLGPATAEGYAEAIRAARELYRADQWEDAQSLLSTLEPESFFTTRERWQELRPAWKSVTHIRRQPRSTPPGRVRIDVDQEVEAAFHRLLVELKTLAAPALETLAKHALSRMGHDEMRAIAAESALAVSGKPALRIDTWDRLSHRQRRSHLFVSSEGRLLCLRMGLGRSEVLEPAFDALAASLAIVPLQGSRGGA